ncbi:MAG: peptidylprolyl isomerase [bacterium]|nr:peptidylprolyl isomerase [bacterium]
MKRIKYVAFAALLFVTGCSRSVFSGTETANTELAAEARIVLTNERNRYEEVYSSQIWEVPVGTSGMNFREYLALQVTDFMQELENINLLAQEKEIVLDKEDERIISQASAKYYDSLTEADLANMNIDKEDVLRLYTKYHLANKTVDVLTGNIDLEVSDSEARVCEVYQIVLDTKESAEAVYAEACMEGSNFENLAKKYSKSSQISRKIARGACSAAEAAVFDLEDGEVSPVIETEEGYCVFYSVEDYDEEATLQRKQEISAARKNTAFLMIYDAFLQEQSPKELQLGLEEVEFSKEDGVQTDCFFEVYQSYTET